MTWAIIGLGIGILIEVVTPWSDIAMQQIRGPIFRATEVAGLRCVGT